MLGDKQTIDKRPVNSIIFDSLHEMIQDLTTTEFKVRYKQLDDGSWIGRTFISLKEAAQALQEPWKEGMKAYDDMMNELKDVHIPPPKSIRRTQTWSEDEGDEIDLDRLKGMQPHLRTTKREQRHTISHVTILCNVTISSEKNSYDLIWRSAATTILTQLLEQAGYRVEIWSFYHCYDSWYIPDGKVHHDNHDWFQDYYNQGKCWDGLVATCVKRCPDPLDVQGLVNVMSGWAFRAVFLPSLHLWDPMEKEGYKIGLGYGQVRPIGNRTKMITHDEKVFLCEDFMSKAEGVKWIKKQLEEMTKQGTQSNG